MLNFALGLTTHTCARRSDDASFVLPPDLWQERQAVLKQLAALLLLPPQPRGSLARLVNAFPEVRGGLLGMPGSS